MLEFLQNLNSICIGPGIGTEKEAEEILKAVLTLENHF